MEPFSELEAQRQATDDFIKGNPVSIALTRHTKVPDGAGGYTTTTEPLDPQDFNLVGQVNSPEMSSEAGDLANYQMQLIGYHDADVRDGDEFILKGGRYRVTFVYPEDSYRVNVTAVYRGAAPA